MSRRKHLAPRTASGRLKPATHLLAPTQIRRLLDSAATEVRHQAFGTQLGRLYLNGQVSATEFAAGKRWAEIVANYSIACRSPSPPRTLSLDAIGIDRPIPTPPPASGRCAATSVPARNILPAAMRCVSSVSRPSVWSIVFVPAIARWPALVNSTHFAPDCKLSRRCGRRREKQEHASSSPVRRILLLSTRYSHAPQFLTSTPCPPAYVPKRAAAAG